MGGRTRTAPDAMGVIEDAYNLPIPCCPGGVRFTFEAVDVGKGEFRIRIRFEPPLNPESTDPLTGAECIGLQVAEFVGGLLREDDGVGIPAPIDS